MNDDDILTKEKENIKIERLANGIYKWSLKLLGDEIGETELKRLSKIDTKLKETYPCIAEESDD